MKLLPLFATGALSSVYLHVPRGSNNRLNENSAQNKNPNRLFETNNNRRGGYNVGEKNKNPFQNEDQQYAMTYFQSGLAGASKLTVEWTQELGCGVDQDGDKPHDCKVIMQYSCQDDVDNPAQNDAITMRNGRVTESQEFDMDDNDYTDPKGGCFIDHHQRDLPHNQISVNGKDNPLEFCIQHCRNNNYAYAGLQFASQCFCGNNYGRYGQVADEECHMTCGVEAGTTPCGAGWRNNVHLAKEAGSPESQSVKNTRRAKSSNANRGIHESWEEADRCDEKIDEKFYGLECKSERESYPNRIQTSWIDAAVFVDDLAECGLYEHNNHAEKFECVEKYSNGDRRHKSKYQNETSCTDNGGEWLGFYKSIGEVKGISDSQCEDLNDSKDGFQYVFGLRYSAKDLADDSLPSPTCVILPAKAKCLKTPNTRANYLGNVNPGPDGALPETPRFIWDLPRFPDDKMKRCVFRIRNIITAPDAARTYSTQYEFVGGDELVHAVPHLGANFGNTIVFEDRSHIFKLRPRGNDIEDDLVINNIVVRGKRGNIVQTFPAVEYDFVPNRLTIKEGEAVQIQWTGSNTHNNGAPAGDGQAGDAGEGQGGTDRHSFIQMYDRKHNFVMPSRNHTFFQNSDWVWSPDADLITGDLDDDWLNLSLGYATSGFYKCKQASICGADSFEGKNEEFQAQFNNASPSYEGHVIIPSAGTYHYKCIRNDNFSNRSQKGSLIVEL